MRTNFFKYLMLTVAVGTLCQAAGFSSCRAQQGPGPGGGINQTTLTAFETDDFSGSGICAMCHSGLTDEAGNDVSNDAQWRSTMMANAAKDPLWQAKISSEVDRIPALHSTIEEKCSRCHMGMARYQALENRTPVAVLGSGFLDPAHYLHEAAMDGVSCTLCHQVQPEGLGTLESFTGKYVIDTATNPPDRSIFGPYAQPVQNPMRQRAGFLPTLESVAEPHLTDSAHCGSCHTLYTPSVDSAGEIIGEFPEQTTFLEWAHSGSTVTCQDCHLPDAVGSVVISNRPATLAARTPFGQHHYVGGNRFMVNLLKVNAIDLGVTADAVHFDDTITRTLIQLEDTAILAAQAVRTGDTLSVVVDVENLAGHKLPSGLPSRRCWLHVVVTDASKTIFESGRPLTGGGIEGNDAENPGAFLPFERHYDTITSADQVQIYEPIMLNSEEAVTYTLLRANSYAKDNRLLPAGFDKASADEDIAVYGEAAADENFVGGSDQVTYEVDVAGARGRLNVTVELLYQALSKPFVDDLSITTTDLVNRFMGMYDSTDNAPEVLDVVHTSAQ